MTELFGFERRERTSLSFWKIALIMWILTKSAQREFIHLSGSVGTRFLCRVLVRFVAGVEDVVSE
ncbi:hypothetical protein CHS0354_038910, partial [Potamilus streckersoni]